MKAFLRIVVCFGTVALLSAPFALAQKSTPPSSEPLATMKTKDDYTRAKLHTELGSMYFQDGNAIVALEELTIAISIDPKYAPAYSVRAIVLHQLKEYESADKDFQIALSLDEKDPEIANNYGWYLCQRGKVKESIPYFERAIRNTLYQTPEIAYLNAGSCYAKAGELDLAEDYVQKSLRFSPGDPRVLFQLANIDYLRGNDDAAKKYLTEVARKVEPNAEILWLMIRVERRLGDRSAEANHVAQLRRKFPESQEYRELLKGNY